jgi:hypothetical protein
MADNRDANQQGNSSSRDRYRDNDDMREPLEGDARTGGRSDTKSEARGDARQAVGNTARDTDADPTGPDGNDRTRNRPRPDGFDDDLASDKHPSRE